MNTQFQLRFLQHLVLCWQKVTFYLLLFIVAAAAAATAAVDGGSATAAKFNVVVVYQGLFGFVLQFLCHHINNIF